MTSPTDPLPELPRWKRRLFTGVMLGLVFAVLQSAAYAYLRVFRGYDGHHLMQYEFDPYKNILPTRNYVDTRGIRHNAVGFRRSTEVTRAKPPGTYRIFLMGGSTAYGLGGLWSHIQRDFAVIPNTETIDAHLERVLGRALPGVRVEVINAAITSTWTHHNFIYLNQTVLGYDPDMVLFLDGFNDAFFTNPDHDQWADYAYGITSRVIEGKPTLWSLGTMNGWWLFRKVSLFHVIGRAAGAVKLMLTPRPPRHPVDVEHTMAGLRQVFPRNALAMHGRTAAVLRHEGVHAVFMLQPMLILERDRPSDVPKERELFDFNVSSYLPNYEAFMHRAAPWVASQEQGMADSTGAMFLDLTHIFDRVPAQVFTDYCHLTPLGNTVLADTVASHILPLIRADLAADSGRGGAAPSR